jgi:pyruvate formate lyase activating enzyme
MGQDLKGHDSTDLCDRRRFLKRLGALSGAVLGASLVSPLSPAPSPFSASGGTWLSSGGLSGAALAQQSNGTRPAQKPRLKEASFYTKLPEAEVECQICPRKCRVGDIERGYCGARENRGGVYYSLGYALPCAVHVDPIEKKPFFHYLPGTKSFSLGTAGCNMDCKFCQNWEMSQARPEQTENYYLPPKETVEAARRASASTVAFTYSEPGVVTVEYMLDVAREGNLSGVRTVMVSNGYINREPMLEACKHLGAVKIDLKAFTEKYYKEVCDATLKPVLDTLVLLKSSRVWYEMVYLVLPTLNDGDSELSSMSKWVARELGPDVPLHFSRFYPIYKMKKLPQTPISTLDKARRIALSAGLNYVYIGNVPGHEAEHTYCPKCKKPVVKRAGYSILEMKISQGRCAYCKNPIAGVWG